MRPQEGDDAGGGGEVLVVVAVAELDLPPARGGDAGALEEGARRQPGRSAGSQSKRARDRGRPRPAGGAAESAAARAARAGGRAELGVERRASVSRVERTMVEGPRAAATATSAVPPEPNATEACVSQSAAGAAALPGRAAEIRGRSRGGRRRAAAPGARLPRGGVWRGAGRRLAPGCNPRGHCAPTASAPSGDAETRAAGPIFAPPGALRVRSDFMGRPER